MEDPNGWLAVLLFVAAVVIFHLWTRVTLLTRDMQGQALAQLNDWKRREYENVRREQAEVARREAASDLQRWRIGAEKDIRRDAVNRSQAVTVGKVTEHIAPYLPDFNYNPKDARFVGSPVDFIVFDGLSDDETVSQIIFIEVKAGTSALSGRERKVRDAVKAGRVKWEELRVQTELLS